MERTVEVAGGVIVRPMEIEDISGAIDIDRRTTGLNRAATYRDQINSYLGGDLALSYVAESDGRVVGFVLGRIRDLLHGIYEGAWIEMIGVDPEYKRQGIGRRLVEGFIDGCRARGTEEIHIVLSSSDPELKPFIQSVGFGEGEQIHFRKRIPC